MWRRCENAVFLSKWTSERVLPALGRSDLEWNSWDRTRVESFIFLRVRRATEVYFTDRGQWGTEWRYWHNSELTHLLLLSPTFHWVTPKPLQSFFGSVFWLKHKADHILTQATGSGQWFEMHILMWSNSERLFSPRLTGKNCFTLRLIQRHTGLLSSGSLSFK